MHLIPLIGFLPIEVSNAVPDILASQNEASPPPLPPRIFDDEDTPQPSPPDSDSMQQPPPVPVKKARRLT